MVKLKIYSIVVGQKVELLIVSAIQFKIKYQSQYQSLVWLATIKKQYQSHARYQIHVWLGFQSDTITVLSLDYWNRQNVARIDSYI